MLRRLHYLGAAAATAVSYAAAVKQADTARRKFGEGDERLACSAISFFTLLSPSGLSSEESWAVERLIVMY